MKTFSYDPKKKYKSDPKVVIGVLKKKCKHCGAKKCLTEAPDLYCLGGKIYLLTIQEPPGLLKNHLLQDIPGAKHFRRNLLKYISFQMTSFGADKNGTNLTIYKIQGQCYPLDGVIFFHSPKNLTNLCWYISWMAVKQKYNKDAKIFMTNDN